MGDDLHSIAFSSLHSPASPDSIGLLNAAQIYMEMDGGYTPPIAASCHHSYATTNSSMSVDEAEQDFSSTGYLQDVLFEFSSKRRRLQYHLFADDDPQHYSENRHFYTSKNCWTSDFIQNCCGNIDTLEQNINPDGISDMKTGEEAISETYSSSSSQKESTATHQWTPDDDKGRLYCVDPMYYKGGKEKIKKKRVSTKVVYPFDVVKPEGSTTLNDINKRILMRPTRPVRHPVGDFACMPLVSPQGPGLSGKDVVAFTKLHTRGSGTITIIRTRG